MFFKFNLVKLQSTGFGLPFYVPSSMLGWGEGSSLSFLLGGAFLMRGLFS